MITYKQTYDNLRRYKVQHFTITQCPSTRIYYFNCRKVPLSYKTNRTLEGGNDSILIADNCCSY